MHMPLYVEGSLSNADYLLEAHQVVLANLSFCRKGRVLELGCGRGVLAVEMARRFDVPVTGIASTSKEIEDARRRAVDAEMSELCTFYVEDMNRLHEIGLEGVSAVVSVESDCYLSPLGRGMENIRRVLSDNGTWHTIRYGVTDFAIKIPECRRTITDLERGWRTAPWLSISEFRRQASRLFTVESRVDLSDRVLSCWSKFVPIDLDDSVGVLKRFMNASIAESLRWRDIPMVLRHRLGFWSFMRGLAAGWFVHEYYKLRAR